LISERVIVMPGTNRYTPDEMKESVRMLVCRKTGLKVEAVRPESRLLHDLGITGGDAEELIQEFAQTFSVDMSSFPFGRYFTGEPGASHVLWVLRIRKDPIWKGKVPLTVRQLVDVALAGHWIEQPGTWGRDLTS
jgi:hypothetical protein